MGGDHMKNNKLDSLGTMVSLGFMSLGVYVIASGDRFTDQWFDSGLFSAYYDTGADHGVHFNGNSSLHIQSRVPAPPGLGIIKKTLEPEKYLGRRICMSGHVKADGVKNWCGLWMRVDGPGTKILSFDCMKNRSISGTKDWEKYDIVLDVPSHSVNINYGLLLAGAGKVWADAFAFKAFRAGGQQKQ